MHLIAGRGILSVKESGAINRLAEETSPYLLQHAHNPVAWYPWCSEALQQAQNKDKPILLSIGYSACHWCHVMAHESFEDGETACMMNQLFVNIKVDREERPGCPFLAGHISRRSQGMVYLLFARSCSKLPPILTSTGTKSATIINRYSQFLAS